MNRGREEQGRIGNNVTNSVREDKTTGQEVM